MFVLLCPINFLSPLQLFVMDYGPWFIGVSRSKPHTYHSYEKVAVPMYVCMYVCMYVAIRRPRVRPAVYACAYCNSVKIVNVDCMLLNSNCSSLNQEPVVAA